MSAQRHRVVIIGSGFGGLFAARKFKKADVDVTIIAKTNQHLFQPMLYQVATGIVSEGEIAPATRVIVQDQQNVRVVLGEVDEIDLEAKTVTSRLLERVTTFEYDSLIVAAGANQSYFGNDHFAEYAPGMKTLDDALELRGRILGSFEQAELSDDPEERAKLMTFVVIGAGPTGVELAGQIKEMGEKTLRNTFTTIDPTKARVILLDAAPAVLPPMGPKLGAKAQRRLEKLGVEVQLNAMVIGLDHEGLTVKEKDGSTRRIDSFCKVWSAGVAGSPLGEQLAAQCPVELDRAGRVIVGPDLSLPGHPNVFVVGDMMSVPGVPGVAQGAIQGGRYAAKAIIAGLDGQKNIDRKPFSYFDKGSMATVSRFSAVMKVGKLEMEGFLAWMGWLVLHLIYLVGFRSRFTTMFQWCVSFATNHRGQLAITEQQVLARNAMVELTVASAQAHAAQIAAMLASSSAASAVAAPVIVDETIVEEVVVEETPADGRPDNETTADVDAATAESVEDVDVEDRESVEKAG